jgi:hypothetical protein
MKKLWIVEPYAFTGGMTSSWMQSYGISRNERTKMWILWDRRDSRQFEQYWSIDVDKWTFESIDALLGQLDDSQLPEVAAAIRGLKSASINEIRAAIRARRVDLS